MPGSSVGIVTDYGLDGPGSNPGGDEIFRPSRPALGPTQPPVKWGTGSFPGVKCGRSVIIIKSQLPLRNFASLIRFSYLIIRHIQLVVFVSVG